MHALLNHIAAHPHWVLLTVFLVAFTESIVLVGTLIPAGIVMFTAGTLVGAHALDLWVTLGLAVLGAVTGDGLSYELGNRYQERIRAWRIFQRRAVLIGQGEQLIQRHGAKSILLARFIAPVRAIVPVMAGMAHMPRIVFYSVNVGSALAWAPAHILPGVVFGASIALAEAVSGRIAAILLLLAALVWLVSWATRVVFRNGMPILLGWRNCALQWASNRPSRPSRSKHWVSILLDPQKPNSQALLVWALLFIGSSGLFLIITKDVITRNWLVQLDAAVFNLMQALRTAPADHLMIGITELGSARVRLAVAVAVAGWLILKRCWRTARYWVIMVGMAEGMIRLLVLVTGRPRPLNLYNGIEHFSFPSGHATSSMIIYGFLAYLIACRQSSRIWVSIAVLTAVSIALIGISRLYLGAHWLSDVLASWSLGVAWLAFAIFTYTHRRVREDLHPKAMGILALAIFAVSGSWTIMSQTNTDLALYTPQTQVQTMSLRQWTDTTWQHLPKQRMELGGDKEEPFLLQWAESADHIRNRLQRAGWQVAPRWSVQSTLLWLAPNTAVTDLPVLPKYDQGKSSRLAFVFLDPQRPQWRIVLRLWRSSYLLQDSDHPAKLPVWYGAFYEEGFKQPWHLFMRGITSNLTDTSVFTHLLPADLTTTIRPIAQNASVRSTVLVLPETRTMSRSYLPQY